MELNILGHATVQPNALLAPTSGAAGENSVRNRMDGSAQVTFPITDRTGLTGTSAGHRSWSPLIT